MPAITINIPDGDEILIADNFCEVHGWRVELGVTKRQFIKQKLIEHIRNSAKINLQRNAQATAGAPVDAVPIT